MMNKILNTVAAILMLTLAGQLQAQRLDKTTVFESGKEGYKSFRIPAIISLPNGDLIAFAEGRVTGAADFGHVQIVMKKSADQGKTWGPLKVVAANGRFQAGNAAPVLDLTDPKYPKGRLFLFYNTGDVDEGQMRQGKGIRHVLYTTSVDGGKSWSKAVDITDQTSKINRPDIKASWNHPEDWRSYANTPGHGLQLRKGPYKGRLYIAANHSEGTPKKDFTDYVAHGYYSDDHGKTFHISENNPLPGSNESSAAEISGGRVMTNTRNQKGDIRARIVAISQDGGGHWDTAYFDQSLPDPVCEGSILTLKYGKDHNVMAFCNDASRTGRDSLTLRISTDDAKNWQASVLIAAKNTAYSDIVGIGRHEVGVLYEGEGYKKIIFTTVNWKHLLKDK